MTYRTDLKAPKQTDTNSYFIDPYDSILDNSILDAKINGLFDEVIPPLQEKAQPPPPLKDHSWRIKLGSFTIVLESDSFLGKISEFFQIIIAVFKEFRKNPKQFYQDMKYGSD